MSTSKDTSEYLAEILRLYKDRRKAIQARLADFVRVRENDYFYELVYCLLTPQSSAEHAERVVMSLRENGFAEQGWDPEAYLRDPRQYIRFHRTKARHLLIARLAFPQILSVLANGLSPVELREWLVRNVKGLGYKEATHFLRNVGRNGGLAILDRHILRNLNRLKIIRSMPAAMTKKRYLAIERKFQAFAGRIGIPLDELDLLFWSMETGEIRK